MRDETPASGSAAGDADATVDWRSAEDRQADIARAQALAEQAALGGLRFEVYLPPGLATWVLARVTDGVFIDPSEAVFVGMTEVQDLEPHADLREELLRRMIQASIDDPRPPVDGDVFWQKMQEKFAQPLPEPAFWPRRQPPG